MRGKSVGLCERFAFLPFQAPRQNKMKIKSQKQAFLKALQTVSAVITQRDIYPILGNVKISAQDGELLLRATDLKISLTYVFPRSKLEIIQPGELLIPALRLHNLVKETPDLDIVLERKEFNGILACQDGQFCILGEDPEKFPEIPEFEEKASIEISGLDFQSLIKKTLFATTTEKTRYDLDNVLVKIEGDSILFVSTDGKRLALCEKKCRQLGEPQSLSFTVPSRGLQQIDRVLSATTPETVGLSFLENQLLFRTEQVLLSTRLSDAKFPPYEKVIPQNMPYEASFPSKSFASALRRVCFLADDKNKIVEIAFSSEGLRLYTMGEGTGEATVEIPVAFDGEPFDIKFNPIFLLDVLKIIEGNEMKMVLKNGKSAALIKDGEDFQYVVLPIKIEEKG